MGNWRAWTFQVCTQWGYFMVSRTSGLNATPLGPRANRVGWVLHSPLPPIPIGPA